jgi:RNA polymerase sigma-70 factor (ECF subfamily)
MDTPSEAGPDRDAGTACLVRRAQNGDLAAFERLYRQHVNRVYALCLRISADPLLAEDLTQTAFVLAWENLPAFRGESAFSTWLHRLAINVALGDRRAEERRAARVVTAEDLSAFRDPVKAESQELRIDLERAVAALPPALRTAFVLHDVEGYPHDEIARMTGQSSVTSRVRVHRARKLLREMLNR